MYSVSLIKKKFLLLRTNFLLYFFLILKTKQIFNCHFLCELVEYFGFHTISEKVKKKIIK
jgi:hypothetical protein